MSLNSLPLSDYDKKSLFHVSNEAKVRLLRSKWILNSVQIDFFFTLLVRHTVVKLFWLMNHQPTSQTNGDVYITCLQNMLVDILGYCFFKIETKDVQSAVVSSCTH